MVMGEYVLSAFWAPFYFRFGIPLYRQSFHLPDVPPELGQHVPALESQLPRSWWQGAVVFRALGRHELAFRQGITNGSRNAIHGRVLFDPWNQQISITGYVYWSFLLFPLLFLAMGFFELFFLPFVAFLLFILLINVIQQRKSYQRVATAVQNTLGAISPAPDSMETAPLDPFAPSPNRLKVSHTEWLLLVVLLLMLFVTGAVFAVYWFGL